MILPTQTKKLKITVHETIWKPKSRLRIGKSAFVITFENDRTIYYFSLINLTTINFSMKQDIEKIQDLLEKFVAKDFSAKDLAMFANYTTGWWMRCLSPEEISIH